jgi:hypothetical protein
MASPSHLSSSYGGMLIGTSHNSILELSLDRFDLQSVVHSMDGLMDMTLTPNNLVSVSSTGVVTIHQKRSGHVVTSKTFDHLLPSSICSSEDGQCLFVGLRSNPSNASDYPSILLLDASCLGVIGKQDGIRDDICFMERCHERVYVGTQHGSMTVYHYDKDTQSLSILKEARGSEDHDITGFDLSDDESILRYTTSSFELKYLHLESNEERSAEDTKDVSWSSHFVHYSYDTEGMWLKDAKFGDMGFTTSHPSLDLVMGCHSPSPTAMLFRKPVRRPDQPHLTLSLPSEAKKISFDEGDTTFVTLGESTLGCWSLGF